MFEMFVVIPTVWKSWPLFQNIIYAVGFFVFSNIVTNFVGLITTCTQVPQEVMSTSRPSMEWQFCDACLSYVPPRSWHCKYCKVCILKRDHHCLFAGCCIGQFNHRFFIMFLIYIVIGTLYCVVCESIFLLKTVDLVTPLAPLKIIFPAYAYLTGLETLSNECSILLYVVNWIALCGTSWMLHSQICMCLRGQVTHDKTVDSFTYDLGKTQNIKEVLGNRWYVAWIFPFISSPLPSNGLEWYTADTWRIKCQKRALKTQ